MSAEGTPQVETTILSRLLVLVARLAIRFPVPMVALALVAVVVAVVLSSTRLGYHTSRAALLDRGSDYHRRWLDYVDEFGDKEDVVVVVQADNRQAILPVLDEVAAETARQRRFFTAVLHEIDLTKVRAKGLHYLPTAQLQAVEGFLGEVEPIIRGGWAWLSPGTMAAGMCVRLQNAQPAQVQQALAEIQPKLGQLVESLLAALGQRGAYQSPWPDMSAAGAGLNEPGSRRLLTGDGRLGFVLLRLAQDDKQNFAQNSESIDALRRLIAQAKARHPNVEIGLTGLPVMENDEMRCSQSSMTLATFLSFAGVLLVVVAGFGGLRHSLLAMAALLLGMVWSLGYTTLAVGHLNILSSAFGAILTGLGINYGIYYVAQYLQLRKAHFSTPAALIGTAGSVAPGITIGAVSTAIAFFMAGFTEFKGVAELGVVAGGGIILCWLAAMAVLPAIIQLSDAKHPDRTLPTPLDFHLWIKPLVARPRLVLGVSLAGTGLLMLGMSRLWYDHNLLNLQPVGLESVELERKLLAETKESASFALSMAKTPQELLARKAQFLQLPSVERVEEIASLMPAGEEQKCPIIQRIQRRLVDLPEQAPRIPVAPPAELAQMLALAQPLMAGSPLAAVFQRQLQQINELLGRLPEAEYYARLSEYQQRLAGDLLGRLRLLQAVADPNPPQWSDLPPGMVTRFVGRHGRQLLKIYSKADIWNMDAMEQFVRQVRSVDPEATGNPLQVYEASRQMKRSYEQATWYALVTIVPVVFLNFGSVRCTLLATLPLILGTLQMFGVMGLLDIPLNPANMIALPLMLGMGVDNGVHIVHDYLSQRRDYRMSASTGVAVVLNTLTTMVGFAVLILADHQGLQSLGRVLTIGMSCCLFSSLVILPTLLVWLTQGRAQPAPQHQPSAEPAALARPVYRRFDSAHPAATGRHVTAPTARQQLDAGEHY